MHFVRDYIKSIGHEYLMNIEGIVENGQKSTPRGSLILENLMSVIVGNAEREQLLSMPLRNVADFNKSEGKYLIAELFWYFSGSRRTEFIGMFGSTWENIQNIDNTVNSNYGRQVFYEMAGNRKDYTRFEWAIKTLINDTDSRQSIIPYTSQNIFDDNIKDFTCSQLQHLFVRDKNLYSVVYLRSSDAVYGLSYDIPWWSVVHQMAAHQLENSDIIIPSREDGELGICIGSSHIYEDNFSLCKNIVNYYEELQPRDRINSFKSLKVKFDINIDPNELIFKWQKKSLEVFGNEAIKNSNHIQYKREEDYYTPKGFHFVAKDLMYIFKKIDSNVEESDKNNPKYKEFWLDMAKDYFDHCFEIV